jgi:hypothetical protein
MTLVTELRGNWVNSDAIVTLQQRQELIQKMGRARLNTVFLKVPTIGKNHGEGEMEPFFDFLHDCKAAGFVVFGWIANQERTLPTGPVDLRLPEEQTAQAKWVEDILINFPCLDGIALDYVGYSTLEQPDLAKQEGASLTVKAIRAVTDKARVELLTTSFPAATVTYRGVEPNWQGEVPKWFQEWYAYNSSNYYKLEASKGGTGLVDRVNLKGSSPNYLLGPSFMSYQQDPTTWMGNGFIDYLVPMQYTSDPAVMRNEIDIWASFTQWAGRPMSVVSLGLGWFDELNSFPDSKLDAAAIVEHIAYGRSKGVGGYTIFQLGHPGIDDTPLINALTVPNNNNAGTPPNPTNASSPFQNFGLLCTVMPDVTSAGGRAMLDSGSFWTFTVVLSVLLRGTFLR